MARLRWRTRTRRRLEWFPKTERWSPWRRRALAVNGETFKRIVRTRVHRARQLCTNVLNIVETFRLVPAESKELLLNALWSGSAAYRPGRQSRDRGFPGDARGARGRGAPRGQRNGDDARRRGVLRRGLAAVRRAQRGRFAARDFETGCAYARQDARGDARGDAHHASPPVGRHLRRTPPLSARRSPRRAPRLCPADSSTRRGKRRSRASRTVSRRARVPRGGVATRGDGRDTRGREVRRERARGKCESTRTRRDDAGVARARARRRGDSFPTRLPPATATAPSSVAPPVDAREETHVEFRVQRERSSRRR